MSKIIYGATVGTPLNPDKLIEHVQYGKSAYELAVDNGFKGTEKEWLESLNGQDGVSTTHSWNDTVLTITSASGSSSADLKGEKGDTGVIKVGEVSTEAVTSIADIKKSGVYKINDELYIAEVEVIVDDSNKEYEWNTTPEERFYFVGEQSALSSLPLENPPLVLADYVWKEDWNEYAWQTFEFPLDGYPLLSYNTMSGGGNGGVFLYLSSDYNKLIVYHVDYPSYMPSVFDPSWEFYLRTGGGICLADEIYDFASNTETGIDICGNWALVKHLFLNEYREPIEPTYNVTAKRCLTEVDLGDVDQVLDNIIAIQDTLIGGDT